MPPRPVTANRRPGTIFKYTGKSLSITVRPLPPAAPSSSTCAAISGRLDYGIGRILKHRHNRSAEDARKQHFESLLIIIEAKARRAVLQAVPQLLAYLACLRQTRLRRHRKNASVYGVASDGYCFIFVMITHHGVVKLSDCFNLQAGAMLKIMGCLKYILETTMEMSLNVTPEE